MHYMILMIQFDWQLHGFALGCEWGWNPCALFDCDATIRLAAARICSMPSGLFFFLACIVNCQERVSC